MLKLNDSRVVFIKHIPSTPEKLTSCGEKDNRKYWSSYMFKYMFFNCNFERCCQGELLYRANANAIQAGLEQIYKSLKTQYIYSLFGNDTIFCALGQRVTKWRQAESDFSHFLQNPSLQWRQPTWQAENWPFLSRIKFLGHAFQWYLSGSGDYIRKNK